MADRVPFFWFHFTDRDDARAVTRRAGIVGAVSAALTAAVAVAAIVSQNDTLGRYANAWSFLDVGVLLALSYGTWRGNRFAATALLVVYVVEQVVTRLTVGSLGGLFVTGFFVVVFVQGMLGAFALHRLHADDDLDGALAALETGAPDGDR